MLISYLKRLEGIKVGPFKASLKHVSWTICTTRGDPPPAAASRGMLARQRVVVLVDELDRGWDSSENAKAFVSGLFQACVSINEMHDNLRVYVSLRQELYEDIPALYEDAQKYRDLLETINWTEESLLKLIAKRIRHCAQENGHKTPPSTRPATARAGTPSSPPRPATRRTIPSGTWSAGR